jgi:hypothetical protein
VAWALQKAPASRVRRHDKLESFFDDAQIEVQGRYFEGAQTNYHGDTTYSWQTFWVGPFIADQILSKSNIDLSEHLPALLHDTQPIWEDAALLGEAHFYADSGSSAASSGKSSACPSNCCAMPTAPKPGCWWCRAGCAGGNSS